MRAEPKLPQALANRAVPTQRVKATSQFGARVCDPQRPRKAAGPQVAQCLHPCCGSQTRSVR